MQAAMYRTLAELRIAYKKISLRLVGGVSLGSSPGEIAGRPRGSAAGATLGGVSYARNQLDPGWPARTIHRLWVPSFQGSPFDTRNQASDEPAQ